MSSYSSFCFSYTHYQQLLAWGGSIALLARIAELSFIAWREQGIICFLPNRKGCWVDPPYWCQEIHRSPRPNMKDILYRHLKALKLQICDLSQTKVMRWRRECESVCTCTRVFVYVSCYGSRSNLCNPEEEKQELKNIEVKMANLGYNSGIHCFLTVTLFHKHRKASQVTMKVLLLLLKVSSQWQVVLIPRTLNNGWLNIIIQFAVSFL